jgi:hypothetical protein
LLAKMAEWKEKSDERGNATVEVFDAPVCHLHRNAAMC